MIKTYSRAEAKRAKARGKYVATSWNGDCYLFTIYRNKAEYERDVERDRIIEEECRKAREKYC